uniref:Uncharacterized protein n=1 Tax=Arundo donax TaxID=35708 RepID=A0A0A9FNK0_ARUDO
MTCVAPVFLGMKSWRSLPSHQSFSLSRLSITSK